MIVEFNKCPKCNFLCREIDNFCEECGTRIKNNTRKIKQSYMLAAQAN
jgi:hypothetical protein